MTKRPVLLALVAVVAIVVFPLVLLRNDESIEFGGADGQAADEVGRIDPDHSPWFEPLWSPPGGETESLLFALQAALGAGVIGYVVGSLRTRHRLLEAADASVDLTEDELRTVERELADRPRASDDGVRALADDVRAP